jgi:hypothetical protein
MYSLKFCMDALIISTHTDSTEIQPTQLGVASRQDTTTHTTCKYIHCIKNYTHSYNNIHNNHTGTECREREF